MKKYAKNTVKIQDPERFHRWLEWLFSFLICRFRFVHSVLGMMNKFPGSTVDTIGVAVTSSGYLELHYNPQWLETLTDEEATYVLYHEVLHVVLHHVTVRRKNNHQLWNIATDLAANELIPQIHSICMPPQDTGGKLIGCHVAALKDDPLFADIEGYQNAEWYYEYILKKVACNASGVLADNHIDDHGGWKEDELADERIRAKTMEIERNNYWGTVSQAAKVLILAAQRKRISWRNRIRQWFGTKAFRGVVSTRKRPNRRTGFIHPGIRRAFVDRWLVAADTSSSISKDLLAEWLAVINSLAEYMPVDFMQFDCEKTEDPHPYERRKMQLEFKGRGGTDFSLVIDIVNKQRYNGVMILTDGQAPAPVKPDKARVLWVMPVGCTAPAEWGETVFLEKS